MTTQVKITKVGKEIQLSLPEDVFDKSEIENAEYIEVATVDKAVMLRPIQNDTEKQQEFRRLKEKIFDKYADVFTALAEGAK